MKKKVIVLLIAAMCLCTACGKTDTQETATEVTEGSESTTEEEIENSENAEEDSEEEISEAVTVTEDAAAADDSYAVLVNEDGSFAQTADGFSVEGVDVYFSDIENYDGLCIALSSINSVCEMDSNLNTLLVNSIGYAPEDFSAEMEEQIRQGGGTVTFSFSADGVENAVSIQVVLDGNYNLLSVNVALAGADYSDTGVAMIFDDYNVHILNTSADYQYEFSAEG